MKDIFKIRKIAIWPLYAGPVSFSVGAGFLAKELTLAGWIFLALGLVLLGTFFVLGLRYWRCPHCRRGFELRQGKIDKVKVCPYCGKKLRD